MKRKILTSWFPVPHDWYYYLTKGWANSGLVFNWSWKLLTRSNAFCLVMKLHAVLIELCQHVIRLMTWWFHCINLLNAMCKNICWTMQSFLISFHFAFLAQAFIHINECFLAAFKLKPCKFSIESLDRSPATGGWSFQGDDHRLRAHHHKPSPAQDHRAIAALQELSGRNSGTFWCHGHILVSWTQWARTVIYIHSNYFPNLLVGIMVATL